MQGLSGASGEQQDRGIDLHQLESHATFTLPATIQQSGKVAQYLVDGARADRDGAEPLEHALHAAVLAVLLAAGEGSVREDGRMGQPSHQSLLLGQELPHDEGQVGS